MYGIQIAFREYNAAQGFSGSPFMGVFHFLRFFRSYQFWPLLANTLGLSFFQLLAGFPMPIILALLLHQVDSPKFKKLTQTVTYAPHFISVVVIVGMLNIFLSPRNGVLNVLLQNMGGEPIFFLGKAEYFKSIYVLSNIWQQTGWGAIVYLAALSGISPDLYEAAKIDGAGRFKKMLYIDLPSILPTITILFILNIGRVMKVEFEKVFLMQNPMNISSSEIISTYVYKAGILNAQYSFSTAVDLFNGLVNLIILVAANSIIKKMSSNSLW